MSNEEEVIERLNILTPKILDLDKRRWLGEDWQRGDLPAARAILFDNNECLAADARLSAVWYTSVLDRGVRYERVWDRGLRQVVEYLKGSEAIPQVRYDEGRYFRQSCDAFGNRAGFFNWLVAKVLGEQRPGKGSLYRLVGTMAQDLLGQKATSREIIALKNGDRGLLGEWKRLWMVVMMLRRDTNYFSNLIKEAASVREDGRDFLACWFSSGFPETESELPVDARVKGFFEALGEKTGRLKRIALIAHDWGIRNGVAPSCIDVAFLPGMNGELFQFGKEKGFPWDKWWGDR